MSPFNQLSALALGVAAASAQAVTLGVVPNWNLLGYSDSADVITAEAFGNPNNVSTVWKWNPVTSGWAFYSPSLPDGGKAYAANKGYEFLTTIKTGDGFWVNAKAPFSVTLPGSAVTQPVVNPEALTGITATLNTLFGLFATGVPAASDPALGNLMDASLLSGGANKSAFVQQMHSGDGPGIGAKLGNVVLVHPTDVGSAANDATHQWFTFDVINDNGPDSPWLAIKNAAGNWLLAGDQRMFGIHATVRAVKHIQSAANGAQVSYDNQLNLSIDSGIAAGVVASVEVIGPGVVPASGMLVYSEAQGNVGSQPCGNNQASTNCVDITQVTAGAKYTFKGYTPAGGTVPTYTYTTVLPTAPLSAAALLAVPFPSITNVSGSWTPGTAVTVNWTLPAGIHANFICLNAWSGQVGNLFNGLCTNNLSGNITSATLTLPNYTGTISGKGVWFNTSGDANGIQFSVDQQL